MVQADDVIEFYGRMEASELPGKSAALGIMYRVRALWFVVTVTRFMVDRHAALYLITLI